MIKHYLVTNRMVTTTKEKHSVKVNAREYLLTSGAEEAQDNLRYGEFSFEPGRIRSLNDFDITLHEDLTEKQQEEYRDKEKLPKDFQFGSRKVFDEIHADGMANTDTKGDVLVFIHGFNNDLLGALQTVAKLHQRYVVPEGSPIKHIVLFTWPSRENLLKYRDDARDAVKSGYALARALMKLGEQFNRLIRDAMRRDRSPANAFCDYRLHLMCHSMGNRVCEAMMTELKAMDKRPNNMFGEILLMAADVDDDVLDENKPMHELISLGERVHVYYHNNDGALSISEKTKNAFNRLGRWGARRTLPLPDDVHQADVSHVGDEETLREQVAHHWYYLNSKQVATDVIDVLNGKVTVFNY